VAGEWGGTLRVDAASVDEVTRHAAALEEALRIGLETGASPPGLAGTHLTRVVVAV
jgi:hypothetical protein